MITARQREIIAAMRVSPEIDPAREVQRRTMFIEKQLFDTGLRSLILGISGGIDSCVCACLAQRAITALNAAIEQPSPIQYRFFAVRLPYDNQFDEQDACEVVQFLSSEYNLKINIQPASDVIHAACINALAALNQDVGDERKQDYILGNTKARLRMVIQYELAAMVNGMVLGTDHSAESVTGYYTKYGDGACDLAPLFGLNKRQVRTLASYLGVPKKIIDKTPTADLETLDPGCADEKALGLSYDDIDDFLEGHAVPAEVSDSIIALYDCTQHKRVMPCVP